MLPFTLLCPLLGYRGTDKGGCSLIHMLMYLSMQDFYSFYFRSGILAYTVVLLCPKMCWVNFIYVEEDIPIISFSVVWAYLQILISYVPFLFIYCFLQKLEFELKCLTASKRKRFSVFFFTGRCRFEICMDHIVLTPLGRARHGCLCEQV